MQKMAVSQNQVSSLAFTFTKGFPWSIRIHDAAFLELVIATIAVLSEAGSLDHAETTRDSL